MPEDSVASRYTNEDIMIKLTEVQGDVKSISSKLTEVARDNEDHEARIRVIEDVHAQTQPLMAVARISTLETKQSEFSTTVKVVSGIVALISGVTSFLAALGVTNFWKH